MRFSILPKLSVAILVFGCSATPQSTATDRSDEEPVSDLVPEPTAEPDTEAADEEDVPTTAAQASSDEPSDEEKSVQKLKAGRYIGDPTGAGIENSSFSMDVMLNGGAVGKFSTGFHGDYVSVVFSGFIQPDGSFEFVTSEFTTRHSGEVKVQGTIVGGFGKGTITGEVDGQSLEATFETDPVS